MESAVNYILTLTYGGKPVVVVESDVKKIYEILQDGPKNGHVFRLIDTQRVVVSAGGTVIYAKVYPTWDGTGIIIMDKYNTIIDSYYKPKPEKRRYRVRRSGTWVTTVWAESEEAAIRQVEQDVAEGVYDVLDGWCEDSDTRVVDN